MCIRDSPCRPCNTAGPRVSGALYCANPPKIFHDIVVGYTASCLAVLEMYVLVWMTRHSGKWEIFDCQLIKMMILFYHTYVLEHRINNQRRQILVASSRQWTSQLRTGQPSIFSIQVWHILSITCTKTLINIAARLVRAHLDFCASWGQTQWFYFCCFKGVTYMSPLHCVINW